MKLLSWNCRALGKPSAIRALKKLIQTHQPDIIFLMETKYLNLDFQKKLKITGDTYPNSYIVDCITSTNNRSGGLCMLWSKNVNLNIIAYNERYIDCYVDVSDNDTGWRATGIYGFSCHHQKPETCNLIKNLFQNNNHDNWLLFGDFNMVLNHAEKMGGRDINSTHTGLFQDTLNDCNMQDIGWHGEIYTWFNNQDTSHHIKERLDRFHASPAWLSKFPRATNYHLPYHSSDHIPILLVFGTNYDFRNDSHHLHTIKRFEHVWLQDPQSYTIIKEEWLKHHSDTKTKLQQAFDQIYTWGQNTFGNIPRQIKTKIHEKKTQISPREMISLRSIR
jgi:exonuclease III